MESGYAPETQKQMHTIEHGTYFVTEKLNGNGIGGISGGIFANQSSKGSILSQSPFPSGFSRSPFQQTQPNQQSGSGNNILTNPPNQSSPFFNPQQPNQGNNFFNPQQPPNGFNSQQQPSFLNPQKPSFFNPQQPPNGFNPQPQPSFFNPQQQQPPQMYQNYMYQNQEQQHTPHSQQKRY